MACGGDIGKGVKGEGGGDIGGKRWRWVKGGINCIGGKRVRRALG